MGLGWRENQLLVLLLLSYDPAFYGEISGQVPCILRPRKHKGPRVRACLLC